MATKNIPKGYLKRKPKNEEWYNKRVEACFSCPFNVINRDKNDLKDIIIKGILARNAKGVCSICHCPVEIKASVKEEHCSLKDKGQEPKWDTLVVKNVKGTKMVLELTETSVFSLTESEGKTIIKGVTASGSEAMNIIFKGYHLKTIAVSCGCIVTRPKKLEDNLFEIRTLIDTTSFAKNVVTKRSIEIEYVRNNKTESHTIHFEITKL